MDPQIANHTWTDSANTSEVCRLYGNPSPKSPQVSPPPGAVATQIAGLAAAAKAVGNLSVASYVQVRMTAQVASVSQYLQARHLKGLGVCSLQLTDTEMECDGVISMDRTPKFTPAQIAEIKKANDALVGEPVACAPLPDAPARNSPPRWLWA